MAGDPERGLNFLAGEGEMAERTRTFDWSQSSLGNVDAWPVALKTSVANMLRSEFPTLVLWGKDLISFYNDAVIASFNGDQHPALGKPARDVWSDIWPSLGPLIEGVMQNGKTVKVEDQQGARKKNEQGENLYWTICYSLIPNDDGSAGGVLISCMETSSRVTARQHRVYETVISATPDLVYVFDLQYRFTYANRALLTMWGKTWDTAIGKGLRENGYEEWHALMHEREIDHVAATGESIRGEVAFPHAVLGRRVYDYILVPVFNVKGEVEAVAGTTRDISDIKQAELRVRESEERFRSLVASAPTAIAVFRGPDLIAEIANKEYLSLVDKKASEFLNKPLYESLPGVRLFIEPIVNELMRTGKPYHGNEFEITLHRHGELQKAFVNFIYTPLQDNIGKIDGFIVVANEVTTQVLARQKIEVSQAALANAIELAELATWKMDVNTGLMIFSSRYMTMFGYESTTMELEKAMLPVIDEDRVIVAKKFEEALQPGTGIFDVEYRLINPTTKQLHIMHSLGQAFFDKFGKLERMEGTTQDVTVQRSAQLALENEVQLRTSELQATNEELASTNEELYESSQRLRQSNQELSQFAHVASHDLQEPVRKISVFAEMLQTSLGEMDDRSRKYLDKIDESANRMLLLIRDVLTHSQISNSTSTFENVDLNKVFENAISEFEVLIEEKRCVIESDELPVIEAIGVQMSQLFSNLISNAIKFAIQDKPLRLNIRSNKMTDTEVLLHQDLSKGRTYYRITFTDNGIGFNQSHANQIFEIFQRLHARDVYSGTGIGLATCKKIVLNHQGEISATSSPGKGATFEVILPDRQS